MFQGLSLEQAPPLQVPLRYYITSAAYLILLSVLVVVFAFVEKSRFSYEVIAMTHTATIGFFSHVMFGSMYQMLPVMLGIAYKKVEFRSNVIYMLINSGLALFLAGFLLPSNIALLGGGILLLSGFVLFSYLSFSVVFESVEKNFLVQNFAMSFVMLFVGSIFGFFALLGHLGYFNSVKFGDIHLSIMLFGWIFLLLNGVSYKIIPMFFVAKEFPSWIKQWLYIAITVLLCLFVYFRLLDDTQNIKLIQIALSGIVSFFALFGIYLLKTRKRSRRDISVDLWYFSFSCAIVASLVFAWCSVFGLQNSMFLGYLTLFGAVYGVINGMLYKIIPFLTWFHLSSAMVFEAEMNNVIQKSAMKRQVWFYFGGFFALLLGAFFSVFLVIGGVLFGISSVLLLRNILYSQAYYKEFIKKKIDLGAMGKNV